MAVLPIDSEGCFKRAPHFVFLAVFGYFLLSPWASAANLPKDERVPGGVAIIKLPEKYSVLAHPKVSYQNQPVAVLREHKGKANSLWVALIGIPLESPTGSTAAVLSVDHQSIKLPFNIRSKNYLEERLTFKNKEFAQPNPQTMDRIKKEADHLNKVYTRWTDNSALSPTLYRPVQGRSKGNFGKKRFINNLQRSQHKGLDIAASLGTPVRAAQSGTVIDIGDYFYTGNTVVLDHGQGLQTLYCHLNQVDVHLNEKIAAKQKIGTVGQTGRATGPHLHFGVNLNNTRVSPDLFFVN